MIKINVTINTQVGAYTEFVLFKRPVAAYPTRAAGVDRRREANTGTSYKVDRARLNKYTL